jgi:hypothetical protein
MAPEERRIPKNALADEMVNVRCVKRHGEMGLSP